MAPFNIVFPFAQFFVQMLFFQVDNSWFSSSATEITDELYFTGYEASGNEYRIVSEDPQTLLTSYTQPVSAVGITLAKPVTSDIKIDVFYARTGGNFSDEKMVSQYLYFGQSMILLGLYALYILYSFVKKKYNIFIYIQGSVILIGFLNHLLSPGSANRSLLEQSIWFPTFSDISLFRKLEIGFSSTFYEFIMKPNLTFVLFSLLLILMILHQNRHFALKVLSALPLFISLVFGMFSPFFIDIFPVDFITDVQTSLTDLGTQPLLSSPKTMVPLLLLLTVFIGIVLPLLLSSQNKLQNLFILLVFLVGFASRMIMSFSPTIFASGSRTFIYMYFSLLICSMLLYQNIKPQQRLVPNLYIAVFAPLSWISNLYFS